MNEENEEIEQKENKENIEILDEKDENKEEENIQKDKIENNKEDDSNENKKNEEQIEENENDKIDNINPNKEDDFKEDKKIEDQIKENENNIIDNLNPIVNEKNEENNEIKNIYEMTRLNDFETNHDFIFRISIVGDCNVGKTSLLTRFCDNTFKESYNNTIGVDFHVVTLKYKDSISKLHIWDTAGQERFKSIALNYFRSSHGFMFVYDISAPNTFNNIPKWIDLAYSNSNNIGINFLVGNKSDLEENRKIKKADGEKFAKEKNLIFFEASAKNNENVEKIFMYFTYKLLNYFSQNKDEYLKNEINKTKLTNNVKELETNQKKKSKCAC